MNCNDVRIGQRVKVVKLEDTSGMLLHFNYLNVRKVGVMGTLWLAVPGYGGDVWLVRHDGCDEIGAYIDTELEKAP
ncbi:MAG: hypothetical protein V1738_01285 [Patescibacteria group bacterium]